MNKIKPQIVFDYFAEISKIPRGSGNEKEISDYIVSFAKKNNLEFYQDDALNVIIKKNAYPGYEDFPVVMLQGHMDMVCEKNLDTVHDFTCDPIKILTDGDYIFADGTTLGAADGIFIAIALALLSSNDIPHPPLEVIFTADEEVGMNGALSLDCSNLNGKLLINIDSEEEGKILTSCAGGLTARLSMDIDLENAPSDTNTYLLTITGLRGGHSGQDIDKERANSNKLMGRLLGGLLKKFNLSLSNISGGGKENAIPRETQAVILSHENINTIKKELLLYEKIFKNEYKNSDPNISILAEPYEINDYKVFSNNITNKIITFLNIIPNGIQSMSLYIPGLPESSLNLGIIKTIGDKINFTCSIRSSIVSRKLYIKEQIEYIAELLAMNIYFTGNYPAWEYNQHSKLKELFKIVYMQIYNTPLEEIATHAGLECGVFAERIDNIDMVSIGPNTYDIHTPNEKLSISSTERTWYFLLAVLKSINTTL